MFGEKKPAAPKNIESLIGSGTSIEGNVHFDGGLRIDGAVKGNVIASDKQPSVLVVSEQAKIEGEVRAAHLIIAGTIVGPVYATEMLELQPKARITGDIHYKGLEMHHGAVVQGMLCYEDAAGKPGLKLAAANV